MSATRWKTLYWWIIGLVVVAAWAAPEVLGPTPTLDDAVEVHAAATPADDEGLALASR